MNAVSRRSHMTFEIRDDFDDRATCPLLPATTAAPRVQQITGNFLSRLPA